MKVSWLNAAILNQIAPTRGSSNTSRECDQRADGERRYRLAVGDSEEYSSLQMPSRNAVQAFPAGLRAKWVRASGTRRTRGVRIGDD